MATRDSRLRLPGASRGNLQAVIETRRGSQGELGRPASKFGQTEMGGLPKVALRCVLPLAIEYVGLDFVSTVFPNLALPPLYREAMIRIGAAIEQSDNKLVTARIVMNVREVVRQRHSRYQPRQSEQQNTYPGAGNQ